MRMEMCLRTEVPALQKPVLVAGTDLGMTAAMTQVPVPTANRPDRTPTTTPPPTALLQFFLIYVNRGAFGG